MSWIVGYWVQLIRAETLLCNLSYTLSVRSTSRVNINTRFYPDCQKKVQLALLSRQAHRNLWCQVFEQTSSKTWYKELWINLWNTRGLWISKECLSLNSNIIFWIWKSQNSKSKAQINHNIKISIFKTVSTLWNLFFEIYLSFEICALVLILVKWRLYRRTLSRFQVKHWLILPWSCLPISEHLCDILSFRPGNF